MRIRVLLKKIKKSETEREKEIKRKRGKQEKEKRKSACAEAAFSRARTVEKRVGARVRRRRREGVQQAPLLRLYESAPHNEREKKHSTRTIHMNSCSSVLCAQASICVLKKLKFSLVPQPEHLAIAKRP